MLAHPTEAPRLPCPNPSCTTPEVDECWSFVMKKERHVSPADPPDLGDRWACLIQDRDSKPNFRDLYCSRCRAGSGAHQRPAPVLV